MSLGPQRTPDVTKGFGGEGPSHPEGAPGRPVGRVLVLKVRPRGSTGQNFLPSKAGFLNMLNIPTLNM